MVRIEDRFATGVPSIDTAETNFIRGCVKFRHVDEDIESAKIKQIVMSPL